MIAKDKIEEILQKNLTVSHIEIQDDSAKHAGHAEAVKNGGGHFSLLIVSGDFDGKKAIERHKFIYRILHEEMQNSIHALSIKAYTPKEYQEK